MKRCLSCFHEYDETFGVCPFCGTVEVTPREVIDLLPGTVLNGRFIIGRSVGSGGFGIIYKGWDQKLERIVAVKEYYPTQLVVRAAGTTNLVVNSKSKNEYEYRKRRFLVEAKNMAKFSSNNNIPNILEFFEANGTAYIVMELLEGIALDRYLKQHKKLNPELAVFIANEVGKALTALHEAKIIHRDVAPDNMFICSGSNLRIKLLDLGAAKLGANEEDVIDIIMKPGYSPVEQYIDDKLKETAVDQRSDVYGLGASLYHMLTGIKPDEATNRKDNQDTVKPPHEVIPEIPENLSNAVMKAMAIDSHMRFKNVPEFLKAINGEKKVISLKKEKRNRKIKQIVGIVAAIAVVGVGALFLNRYYQQTRLKVELNPAQLDVWFAVADGSTEEAAMNSIKNDFESKFPGVVVNLRAISESEYNDVLMEAYEAGNMPDLFESSNVPDVIINDCMKLSSVVDSEQFANCLFTADYSTVYPDANQMPLGIEAPMACVITSGATQVDYANNTFASVEDFGTDIISAEVGSTDLLIQNFDINQCVGTEYFYDSEFNQSAVLLTTTQSIDVVRNNVTNYQKSFVYYNSPETVCRYVYEWSIYDNGDKDEISAATRLLSWMLGNVYQNTLMVSVCSDGQIPMSQECFMSKVDQDAYEGILNAYENYHFVPCTAITDEQIAAYDEAFVNNAGEVLDTRYRYIFNLYENFLQRTPSTEEVNAAIAIADEQSLDVCVTSILYSEEANSVTMNNSTYVANLYQYVLGRTPSEWEVADWVTRLDEEQVTRSTILEGFFVTEEWAGICAGFAE